MIEVDGFYETVSCGGGARTGHVAERTQHSLELRDWYLGLPDLLSKYRPFVVRGGSIQTGPWRVVSERAPHIVFATPGAFPEEQEAFAVKLASILNGDADA